MLTPENDEVFDLEMDVNTPGRLTPTMSMDDHPLLVDDMEMSYVNFNAVLMDEVGMVLVDMFSLKYFTDKSVPKGIQIRVKIPYTEVQPVHRAAMTPDVAFRLAQNILRQLAKIGYSKPSKAKKK
ncbi:MAG: hypothetical protein JWM80_1266 [Cyanobacteria bacterium RYN_339]|nr:hypothetical protein [Cyanobacteria bacterium RYN_339]